jgi:hypothetical protein
MWFLGRAEMKIRWVGTCDVFWFVGSLNGYERVWLERKDEVSLNYGSIGSYDRKELIYSKQNLVF